MATHRKKPLQFEKLEKRIYLSATPEATLIAPAEVLCEEDITMAVRFDNTSGTATDVGYAPYVEVAFDPQYDISGATISYLGQSVTPLATITLDNTGSAGVATNPLTGNALTLEGAGFEDYNVMVIQLPFGSFVPDQPVADLDFAGVKISTTDVAVLNNPQPIKLAAGFALGEDPLNNPGSDDPTALTTTDLTGVITPKLYKIDKTTDLSEEETAIGPNYPFTYTVPVDVAEGKTITDFVLTDSIPDGFIVQEVKIINGTVSPTVDSATINGSGITLPYTGPEVGPFASPNNDIVVDLAGFTGAAGEDFKLEINGYFQDKLADGTTDVVPEADPDDTVYRNDIATTATFSSTNFPDSDFIDITAKALIVQKTSTPNTNVKPGDIITHEVTICLSDYFRIGRESIPGDPTPFDFIDTIPDGLDYYSTFKPEISVDQESAPGGPFQDIAGGNLSHTNNTCAITTDPCTETLTVNLGEEVDLQCVVPRLTGDIKNDGTFDSHPAKIIIRYKTKVQDRYGDGHPDKGNVVLKDSFTNNVVVNTQFLMNDGDHFTPPRLLSDGSSSTISLDCASLTKSLYAIDGAPAIENDVEVTKSVVFRLTITLPHADTRELKLTDYIPLPAFDATDLSTVTEVFSPSSTGLTPGSVEFYIPDNTPAITIQNNPPTLSTDANTNSFTLDFGDLEILEAEANDTEQKTIEVYFALNTQDVPMANDLLLTNHSQISYKNFNDVITTVEAIAPIVIKAPDLKISTAIVSTNQDGTISGSDGPSGVTWGAPGTGTSGTNPGFTGTMSTYSGVSAEDLTDNPVVSTLANADAADEARGVIIVQNVGDREAYEIEIQLDNPAEHGTITKVLVSDGDGDPIAISAATFFNVTDGVAINNEADFISALTDEDVIRYVPTLSAEDDANTGGNNDNVLVIAYDFTIQQPAAPSSTNTATATIEEFGSQAGGIDWTAGNTDPDWSDTTQSTIAAPTISKAVSATSETSTSGNDVVIAEIVTYQVSVTMPEGTHSNPLRLVDNIPAGLQYVSGSARILLTSPGFAGTVDQSGALSDGASLTVTGGASDGADITITFDSVTTTGDNNTGTDTFIVEYQAKVLNITAGGNDHDDTLQNAAVVNYDDPNAGGADFNLNTNTSNQTVTVKEPIVNITNNVVVNGSGDTGDAGDPVVYTIVLTADASRPTARDVGFSDVLPAEIDPASLSITAVHSGSPGNIGPTGTGEVTLAGNTVTLLESAGIDLAPGETITITISGNIDDTAAVESGETFNNTATVTWTSADGAVTDERDGSETPAANDYTNSASDTITILSPTIGKTIINTSVGGDTSTTIAIGETITYRVTLTVNEGITPSVTVVDTADVGLEIVDAGGGTVTLNNIQYNGAVSSNNPTTGTLSNSDRTATIDFGNITVLPATASPQTTNITFEYDVVVTDIVANNDGDDLGNNASITWLGGGGSTNNTPPAIVTIDEPELNVAKSVTINGGNSAGDTKDPLVYTYTITHVDGSTAYDVSLSDLFPAEITPLTLDSATHSNTSFGTSGDLKASSDVTLSGSTLELLEAKGIHLSTGETITIQVSAEVTDSNVVTPSETVTNTVNIGWTSTPGTNVFERSYTDQDTADFSIVAPPVPTKTISNTSVGNDTSSTVAVGETITYSVVLTFNDGVTPTVQVVDTVEPGLKFLNNSITLTPGSVDISSSLNPTTGVLSNSDRTITIDLGDVTHAGTPGLSTDTLTITYDVYVENLPTTDATDTFDNNASMSWQGPIPGSHNIPPVTVTVDEPTLSFDKAVTINGGSSPGDTKDPLVYTYTIVNTGTADAFDLDFSDPFPAEVTPLSITSAVITPSNEDITTPGDGRISLSGQNLTIDPLDSDGPVNLAVGETLTIIVAAEVTDSNVVTPGETVTNTATIEWTSTPGTNLNERTGSGGPAENDYTANDSANFSILTPGAPVKSIIDTSAENDTSLDVQVGEVITYQLVLTVNDGTTPGVILTDTLNSGATGLKFLNNSITVTPSAGVSYANNPLTTGVLSNGDRTLTIDLGDVTKTGVSGVATATVTVTYQAYIENDDAAVNAGSTFTNDADFDFTGNGTPLESNEITVTVREPQLTVDKTISPLTGQAGTPVTYTIVIDNPNPNGKAYDLDLADPIPTTISSLSIASAVINPGAVDILAAGDISLSGQNLIINPADNVNLAPGETLTITVNGVIDISASPSEVINNVATIKWTSHPGTPTPPATERNGDGPAPDDYTDNDDADFTVDAITAQMLLVTTTEASTIDQTDPSITTDYAIGERLTFRAIVELPQGTTDDLILEQQLPSNFRFVNDGTARIAFLSDGTSISSDKTGLSGAGLNVAGSNPLIAGLPSGSITFVLPDGAVSSTKVGNTDTYNEGDNVFFQLGNVANPDIDANQEYAVIEFDVIVADTTPVQGENQDISFDVFTSGAGTPDLSSNPVEGRNVFPEVSIVNDFVSTPVEPEVGDTFQMTITIDHLGGSLSDAHNTTITDTLPLNQLRIVSLDSVTGNVPAGVTLANFSIGGTNSELLQTDTDFTLATGEDLTLTYTVEIIDDPSNTPGTTLNNDAELIYSSTTVPVTNPDELIVTKNDNESLSLFAPDLVIAKVVSPTGTITPTQGTITYTITITNPVTATATTADTYTVADTLPLGLTFNSATPTPTTQVGQNATWDFTNLAPGGSEVITVTANVTNPAPQGAETLTNNATVTVTGGQKEFDTTDNQDDESNTLDAAPDLTITITDNLITTTPGSTVTYTIVVTNIGDQDSSLVDVVTQFPGSLPAGDATVALDFISADNGGVFAPGGSPGDDGTITWDNLPALAGNGGNITLTVVSEVKDPIDAGISNFVHDARVDQDDNVTSPESSLLNNDASDTTAVQAAPDYTITITDNKDTVAPGDPVTYVISVSNIGPNQTDSNGNPGQGNQNGTNVTVTQCFPTALINVLSALDNPGAGINNTLIDNTTGKVTWIIDTLDIGETVLLTANAAVDPNAPDGNIILNSVTVADDGNNGPDPNLTNNSDFDITKIEALFIFDSFNNFSNSGDSNDFSQNNYSVFGGSEGFQAFTMSSTTYTGQALPGSSVNITLTDSSGLNLGTQTVTVDPGSNWVAHFPDGTSGEVDNIDIQQVANPGSSLQSNRGAFDLQTHLLHSQGGQFMTVSEPLSPSKTFRELPSNSFNGMKASSEKPIRNTATDDTFQDLESPITLTEN